MRPEERAKLKQEKAKLEAKKEREEKDMYPPKMENSKEEDSKETFDNAKEEIKETIEAINKSEEVETQATEEKAPFETMSNEEAQELVDKGEAEIPEEAIIKEYPFETDKEEVTEDEVEEKHEEMKTKIKANNEEEGWKPIFDKLKQECTKPGGKYYPHVRFLLSSTDAQELWARDEGYFLDNPEIARIDNTKPFIINNCEFKEATNGKIVL